MEKKNTTIFESIIEYHTPSKLFTSFRGLGLIYALENLATQQPDVIVNKTGDVLVAPASLVKDLGTQTISFVGEGFRSTFDFFTKAVWRTTETMRNHVIKYVKPTKGDFSFWCYIFHPFATYYQVCQETTL